MIKMMLHLEQAPDKQRLFKGSIQLEDSKKLADMQIGNDDVLAMTFCQPGEGTSNLSDMQLQIYPGIICT